MKKIRERRSLTDEQGTRNVVHEIRERTLSGGYIQDVWRMVSFAYPKHSGEDIGHLKWWFKGLRDESVKRLIRAIALRDLNLNDWNNRIPSRSKIETAHVLVKFLRIYALKRRASYSSTPGIGATGRAYNARTYDIASAINW